MAAAVGGVAERRGGVVPVSDLAGRAELDPNGMTPLCEVLDVRNEKELIWSAIRSLGDGDEAQTLSAVPPGSSRSCSTYCTQAGGCGWWGGAWRSGVR